MHGKNSILVGGGGPAHQFQGTKIGGEETQARNPGRHFAARQKKIITGVGAPLQVKTDGEDQQKIKDNDKPDQPGTGGQAGWLDSFRIHLPVVRIFPMLAKKVLVMKFGRNWNRVRGNGYRVISHPCHRLEDDGIVCGSGGARSPAKGSMARHQHCRTLVCTQLIK